jgi:flagellar biosynthesis GTPase FlhF
MAINEAVNIDIDVNGVTTVKQAASAYEDLGDAVSQTQLEAERLAQQFGINDKRTQEAIKVAGRYKQEMEELDFAIDAARGGSDQLFRAAQGVTAGFELAAGATALFGTQSEELEKVMMRVQGAMVFAQGLKDLKEFGPALLNLAGTIKGKVVTAFTTLRGAIIATGVGALAVGVGVLIANWEKFTNYLNNSFPALKKAGELIGGFVQQMTDAAGFTSQAAREQERFNDALQDTIDKTDREIKIAQARGDQAKALALEEKKLLDELALAQSAYTEDQSKENLKRVEDAELALELNRIAQDKFVEQQKEAEKKQAEERRAERKRQQEQKEADDKAAADEEFNAWLAQELARYEYDQQLREEAQKKEDEEYEAWLAQELANYEYRKQQREQEAKEEKEAAEQQIANERAVQDAKEAIFNEAQALGNAIIALAGEQSKVGKAIALAQIGADTAKALSSALANTQSPTPDNLATGGLAGIGKYIALAANILTNAKRAYDIIKAPAPSVSGSSSTSATAAASIPQFRPPTQQLPGTEDFTGQNRVYVTEADISNTQNKVKVTEGISTVK